MKKIPLGIDKNKFMFVSNEDFKMVSNYSWSEDSLGYAQARIKGTGRNSSPIRCHSLIMSTPNGMQTDHINGNRLDNRRENLRIVTHEQNQWNRKKRENTSSIYKGIYWSNTFNRWHSRIKFAGKSIHLGYFKSEKEAAGAYDEKAKELFGKFAKLNFN